MLTMPPTALTTVAELQALLRWHDVTEETPIDGLRLFAVRPTSESLPRIEFLFDDRVTLLQQLGFGPWHGHFTEWDNERRNVRRAIATARTLVTGARCVFAERGTGGGRDGYLGSSVLRRSEMPRTLAKGFTRLERIVFNAAPEEVPVDLGRYHCTKDGSYIEQSWRRELKELWARLGRDPSTFD
jgi:hypothetical protein